MYGLSTKTSTPACTEFRTTLECLLIRERLSENCGLRWVNSRAMLADCLTKSMDGEMLSQALQVGQYALFDEHAVLKERADKRSRLKWNNGQSTEETTNQNKVEGWVMGKIMLMFLTVFVFKKFDF